jgi:hypothetical protein
MLTHMNRKLMKIHSSRRSSQTRAAALAVDYWKKLNDHQAAKSPQYKGLLQALQAIHPGSLLLLRSPSDESWLGQLAKRGQLFSKSRIKAFRGAPNQCHQNASCVWIMEQGLIGTGFAYVAPSSRSPGWWHQHSWGLNYSTKTPLVIETTHEFEDYYGVELDNEECKCFVLQNVLPMLATVIDKVRAS